PSTELWLVDRIEPSQLTFDRHGRPGSQQPRFSLNRRRAAIRASPPCAAQGPRRHAASAGTETGRTNLHDAKQRRQPPTAHVLQRTLSPAALAASPVAAMLLRLRLNQMALQP